MKSFPITFIMIVFLLTMGCDKLLLESHKGGETNVEVFETIWNDLDRNYSYFELKNIDWPQLYKQYQPSAASAQTPDQLAEAIWGMLAELKDGHVNLFTDNRSFGYDGFYKSYPANFNSQLIKDNYLTLIVENGPFLYGHLKGTQIGYILIKNFSGPLEVFAEFPALINNIPHTGGLIIDIRNNGGGSDLNSRKIAGHFTEISRSYAHIRFKNGPAHNSFEPWEAKFVIPQTPFIPEKSVLLTNRAVFSSAEDFVLSMRILPNITVIGDTTGGGSGNPIQRELPNGWHYRFSRWQQVTEDFQYYEGIGLYPDIPVWISEEDSLRGHDSILDRAIEYLNQKQGTDHQG